MLQKINRPEDETREKRAIDFINNFLAELQFQINSANSCSYRKGERTKNVKQSIRLVVIVDTTFCFALLMHDFWQQQ